MKGGQDVRLQYSRGDISPTDTDLILNLGVEKLESNRGRGKGNRRTVRV